MLLQVTIALLIILGYILLLLILFGGLLLMKWTVGADPVPLQELTVVIPYRNEASHLPGIIADLLAQDHPGHLYNVIMVNDHSTDGSEKLAVSMGGDRKGFIFLDLPGGKEGKKEAIAFAISLVRTPWVLQMDADCRVEPGFISSHMHFLARHPSELVAGLVTTSEGRGGFLEAFERLELLGLNGSGAGSFAAGRPLMCSGANLLYSVELYRETRKFDPAARTGSGDDMFLLIGARKLKRITAFNPDRDCQVRTSPVGTFADLIRQRIRWGAKSVYYRMPDIQFVAVLVVLANLLMLLTPLWMLLYPEYCPWLLLGVGAKLVADFMILAVVSVRTGQSRTLWWYIPASLLYPFYMATVITGALIGRPTWKGRPV